MVCSIVNDSILPAKLLIAPVQWDIMTEINNLNLQNPPPPECPANLTYVPESLRERLLTQVHVPPSSGHPGITATAHLLKNQFWWPTLLIDTTKFVQNCTICSTSKTPRQPLLHCYNHCPHHNAHGLTSPSTSSLIFPTHKVILLYSLLSIDFPKPAV